MSFRLRGKGLISFIKKEEYMYKKPYIRIIRFFNKDVVCTSNGGSQDPGDEDWWTDYI